MIFASRISCGNFRRVSTRDKISHFIFITITGEIKRIEYFSSLIKSIDITVIIRVRKERMNRTVPLENLAKITFFSDNRLCFVRSHLGISLLKRPNLGLIMLTSVTKQIVTGNIDNTNLELYYVLK